MSDPNPNLEVAAAMATTVPQAAALGFSMVSAGDARGVMHVPWREDLTADVEGGSLASGVVTSIIDHCCGMAITAARQQRLPTATLDLRIDFLRPPAPRSGVSVEAHCYAMTGTVAFVRAHAWDNDPANPIATAQAAFMLSGAPAPGTGDAG